MSTVRALTGLKRLAHDTARLARNHPKMKIARNAMNIIACSGRPDTDDWIDDVFCSIDAILSDIIDLER